LEVGEKRVDNLLRKVAPKPPQGVLVRCLAGLVINKLSFCEMLEDRILLRHSEPKTKNTEPRTKNQKPKSNKQQEARSMKQEPRTRPLCAEIREYLALKEPPPPGPP